MTPPSRPARRPSRALADRVDDVAAVLVVVLGFAVVLAGIARFAGPWWAVGYVAALVALLWFNHAAARL